MDPRRSEPHRRAVGRSTRRPLRNRDRSGWDHEQLLPDSLCGVLQVAQLLQCVRAVRIGHEADYADIRNKLASKLKPLPTQVYEGDAGDVAARPVVARNEAGLDWIEGYDKHDGS